MSDKNKEILENNQEKNQNKPEGNKRWWKNVGLKPNLRTKYEQIKNNIYAQLMQQSHLSSFYNAIDKTGMKYDLSPVITMLPFCFNPVKEILKAA